MHRQLILLIGLFLVSAAVMTGCSDANSGAGATGKGKGGDKSKAPLQPVRVRVGQATTATVRPTIRVTGTLFADENVTVSAKVAGRIISITADLGDRIDPGAALAITDPIDYQLAAKEKQMAVQATLAKVGLSGIPPAEFDAAEVPTVKRAGLQRGNAKAKHDRLKKLFDQTPPLISEQEYNDALTAFEVAQSAYDVELLMAKALLAEAHTRQAEWNVANQRLKDTKVAAPSEEQPPPFSAADTSEGAAPVSAAPGQNGANVAPAPPPKIANPRQYKVAERYVAVGDYVREGAPLFRLIDDDPVKMRAMVPERFAGAVRNDLRVAVKVQAQEQPFEGVVSRVSPQVDEASRTFPVEVMIRNPQGRLKPGTFAGASIELPDAATVASVPAEAVVSFAGVNRVFIVDQDKALEVRVDLGDKEGDRIMVTKGLRGDERVILSPPAQLISGTLLLLDKKGGDAKAVDAPSTGKKGKPSP